MHTIMGEAVVHPRLGGDPSSYSRPNLSCLPTCLTPLPSACLCLAYAPLPLHMHAYKHIHTHNHDMMQHQAQRARQMEAWSAVSGLLKQLWPTAQVHLFGR